MHILQLIMSGTRPPFSPTGDRVYRTKAVGFVRGEAEVKKLWTKLGPRYADRAGGYCRVLRCGFRTGDRAPMAIIEYVGRKGEMRPARPGTAAKQEAIKPAAAAEAAARLPAGHGAGGGMTKADVAAAAASLARSRGQDLKKGQLA